MKKWFPFLLMVFISARVCGQSDLERYLSTHYYSFSPGNGPGPALSDTLVRKLRSYRVILQAEGGSHYLSLYNDLSLMWLRFLNRQLGVTHFFFEFGHSADLLCNAGLANGDSSYWFFARRTMWNDLYTYNRSRPEKNRLHPIGIDFESRRTYVKALRLLLPGGVPPPQEIGSTLNPVLWGPDTLADCKAQIHLNAMIKKSLLLYQSTYKRYLGDGYADFEQIILNPGSCKDVLRNRNQHMAASFLAFDARLQDSIYYGELGQAHTVLNNRNVGSILNQSPGFAGRVCVINMYCDQCSTPVEAVSNWTFKKIEPDIQRYFLPLCSSGFTIFDLSDPSPAIDRFRAYGQFLIIARNQQ